MNRWRWLLLPASAMAALIASTVVTTVYIFDLERREAESHARAELTTLVYVLADGMMEPIWTLIPNSGRPLVDALARDPRVYGIAVASEAQGPFLAWTREGPVPARLETVKVDVMRDGERIGDVAVRLDLAAMQAHADRGTSNVRWVVIAHVGVAWLVAVLLYLLSARAREARTRADRAELEARQRKSEARLAEAQRIAHIGHWHADRASRVVEFSEEALRILGMADAESAALPLETAQALVHEDDRERFRGAVLEAVEDEARFSLDLRIVRPNGEVREATLAGAPMIDDAGRVTGQEGIIQDLTERKATEALLQQAQKMETVGQLTGGIAHDFNNLLSVILGNLQMLERQLDGDERASRRVAAATGATLRGAELTKRLLAFARQQVLEPQLIDAGELVAGMNDLLRRTLGGNIQVRTVLGADLWPTMVDPVQLENALLNLAINARDAMPAGGRLIIETANIAIESADASLKDHPVADDYVMLTVRDEGVGMTAAVQARIFEPFFTTKETGKGSGLGMSMVYGFVKQSYGHLYVDSEVDKGTTIRIYLPRAAGEVAQREAAPAPEALGGSERILLVEDDEDVLETTAAMLKDLGYDVLTARNGKAALEVLENRHDIDLMLTDVMMPGGMSGADLAGEVTERWPHIKVLFASGYTANVISQSEHLEAGAEFLAKPYKHEELSRKLRDMLEDEEVPVSG